MLKLCGFMPSCMIYCYCVVERYKSSEFWQLPQLTKIGDDDFSILLGNLSRWNEPSFENSKCHPWFQVLSITETRKAFELTSVGGVAALVAAWYIRALPILILACQELKRFVWSGEDDGRRCSGARLVSRPPTISIGQGLHDHLES